MKRNWNLVDRYFQRRRAKDWRERSAREAEEQVVELDRLNRLFADNPKLHARILLHGIRGIHYIEPVDLAELEALVADQPEIKCKWN